MITPDEQLALDMLDALDSRSTPALNPILSRTSRQERYQLDQLCRMTAALLGWLERWMAAPQHECPKAQGDPLWRAVSALYQELGRSQRHLWQKAIEIDDATAWRRGQTGPD